MRSTIAPEISAAVMMANVPWKPMNRTCGIVPLASSPTPFNIANDRSPSQLPVPENASE